MLDTGSGPNLIKERYLPDYLPINYESILKLNGINEHPVYTLGEISLTICGMPVIFHIISNNFPIRQSGILGNDFFEQTGAKIDYSRGYLEVSEIKIPFYSPEVILIPARSIGSFYVRIGNPEIKEGYLPKLRVADGVEVKGDAIIKT